MPLDGVRPKLVGAEPALLVLIQERHREDKSVDVDIAAGHFGDLNRRPRTKHGECQQTPNARLGDNPATTSSQRNCLAAPAGADRTSRTNDGHPAQPLAPHVCLAELLGQCGDFGIGERKHVAPDVDDLPAGAPPSERNRHRIATRQHEVRVWRQPCRKLAHEPLTGGHRRELVQVVEEDADVDGSGRAQRLQDAIEAYRHSRRGPRGPRGSPSTGGQHPRRQAHKPPTHRCPAVPPGWPGSTGRVSSSCQSRHQPPQA